MEEEEILNYEQDIDTLSVHEIEELIKLHKEKIVFLEKKVLEKKIEREKAEQIFKK